MAKLYFQLNEPGSGEVSIPLDNPAAADIAILKFIELNYRGENRGGFFVENIDKTHVDAEEKAARWVKASGRGLLAILDEAIIWDWFTDDIELIRRFVAMPKAAMLWTLLDEAHNRQVNIYGQVMDRKCFPSLTWDFTMTHDSLGVAWTDSEDMEFKVGTSLLDVLRQIAALGIDFDIERNWVDGTLQLHAYANGLGNDVSDDVHFRLGYNCTQVTDSEAGGEIRNAFMVNFPDPVYPWVVLTDVPSINKYRRRENFLQAFNASNAATAGAYGQAELDALKNAKHAISLKISDANGPRCFVEYKLGDWISYDDGSGTEVKYRVRGIQLEWTEQWYADVVVELNDVLMETLLRTARDLHKVGSASSGSSLKTPPDIVANSISISNTAVTAHNADLAAHGGSPRSTVINDFIVGSAIGTWIKKTLAETRTILGIPMGGIGDVVGPASAVNTNLAMFSGTTGKIIADSGKKTTDFILHSLADAANDFLVASGANTFVKKTLAEVKTILGVGAGGGHVVQDEGMPLAARANLNFVGLGVAATDDVVNDATVVTIDKNYLYIDQAGGTGDTFGVLAGARDGNNVEFTVSQAAYVSGTLSVYLNGQLLTQGSSEDWHEAVPASGTFHFTAAPEATDEITVAYGYLGINPGGGDVLGPATNHDNYIPQWNGINSKTLKDGMPIVTSIGTPGLDTNIPTEKAVRDAIPTTMAVVREAIFTFEGTLLVVSGKVRIYNKLGTTMTISQVFIAVNTAPAGAAVIVDVHKNGITIFTDQIHRPQIADGQNTGFTTTIDIATLADGDYLTTDIDQIGNASDTLTVHVVYN